MATDGGSPRLFGRHAGTVAGRELHALNADPAQFAGLDCIVHLSAVTTNRASAEDLRRANVDLAVDTARMAAAAGVKRFVFVNSLHVHGKTASQPAGPDAPFRDDNAYGRSKAEAEIALAAVAAGTGLELVVVRPPMIYGRGSKGGFSLLAKLVRAGLPLPFATARGRRSFCSIANAVCAIRHGIAAPAPPAVLLPADPEDFDTAGLVTLMAEAMDKKVLLCPAPRSLLALPLALAGRGEMIVSLFDPLQIDRAHWEALSWRPVESGVQGVRRALGTDVGP